MNRRDLLCRGFALAAGSAVSSVFPFELAAQTGHLPHTNKPLTVPQTPGPRLNVATFEQVKNSHFLVEQTRSSLDQYLQLAEIIQLSSPSTGRKSTGFVLVFFGGSPDRLAQGVYTLSHPKLGKIKMLLVPGRKNLAPEYYATFNQLM